VLEGVELDLLLRQSAAFDALGEERGLLVIVRLGMGPTTSGEGLEGESLLGEEVEHLRGAELWALFVNSHDSSSMRVTLSSHTTSIFVGSPGVKRSECEMSFRWSGSAISST
jgi:hypothetical protein